MFERIKPTTQIRTVALPAILQIHSSMFICATK